MSLKFTWHETPAPEGKPGKTPRHARVVHDETVGMEKLCKLVSASSSFSSADVKGILEAFQFWMGVYLKGGSIIKLEGLGHFFPTLRSSSYKKADGEEGIEVWVDSVGFRCSPTLKNELRNARLEEDKRPEHRRFSAEERQKRILQYLGKQKYANCRSIEGLNNCCAQIALHDLKTLQTEGKIVKIGKARQTLYLLPF